MPQNIAPIALFLYNRADHAKETIEALQNNPLAQASELFVFCDGPKNEDDLVKVNQIVELAKNISGFKKVTIKTRELNRGLAKSVIAGVSELLNTYENIIVLEDDIITAPYFLQFMNDALNYYKNEQLVFSVTGFNFPQHILNLSEKYSDDVFFVRARGCSWGWATWQNRWQQVDFSVPNYANFKNSQEQQKTFNYYGSNLSEMLHLQMSGKIDSWAIRVAYHQFRNGLCTIFPTKTLVKNIGFDGSGAHGDNNKSLSEVTFEKKENFVFKTISELKNNDLMEKAYIKATSFGKKGISKKTILRLKYLILGFIIAEIINFIITLIK